MRRVGESRQPCQTPTVARNQSCLLQLKRTDCIGGLVIEALDDQDNIDTDIVLLHGCPQSSMPNPVEGLLEVYEDMAEVLLVLEIFLT